MNGPQTALVKQALLVCASLSALGAARADAPAGPEPGPAPAAPVVQPSADTDNHRFAQFREFGRQSARTTLGSRAAGTRLSPPASPDPAQHPYHTLRTLSSRSATAEARYFHEGRYNRSRARLPENINDWRNRPDIANPGADLANWPDSAFTLPKGRTYVEINPFGFYSSTVLEPQQFEMEFLLRHGLTDNIELRIFGDGPTWTGGQYSRWGFSPLAFDTKILCWTEQPDLFIPAMGIEAYLQTNWLGNSVTNGGTQPSISFNFDQSLPLELDLEYNIGALRVRDTQGQNHWNYSFEWALQRDLPIPEIDMAVFVHGYVNAPSIPRGPKHRYNPNALYNGVTDATQNAVGAGIIINLTDRIAVWTQTSAGTTRFTPAILSNAGFAVAF